MKRRLVGLGIFSPNVYRGTSITYAHCRSIYRALTELGFVETRWQFIYEGQMGGLVYSYNDGLSEIHIRFFSNRIFAELEFSRSSLFHFVFPLFNANGHIIDLLRNRISDESLEFLIRRTTENLCDDELALPVWAYKDQENPYTDATPHGRRSSSLVAGLDKLLGWRKLVGVIAIVLAISIYFIPTSPPYILIPLLLVALFSIGYMPTVGRP
jgi:hypothetical protein